MKNVTMIFVFVVLGLVVFIAAWLLLGLAIMLMANVMSTEIVEFAVPAIGYKSSVILAAAWIALTASLLIRRQI